MTLSLQFNTPAIILAGIALLSAIYLLTVYRSFLMRIVRFRPAENTDSPRVPVSVVVYCRDNAQQLRSLLPSLLEQNYDAPFEVIVINDGSSEDIKDVVNHLLLSHSNLYITYIPEQARNLSRRKLAVTLGVKAAHYPYVVLTNADAVISSTEWLSGITEPFCRGRELVIGHAAILPGKDHGLAGAWRKFDLAADAVSYLGCAVGGHPYRCTNYNVAFATSLFFNNKGFARSLNLHNGDDDIFISEIATADNTEVVISDTTRVNCDIFNPSKYYTLNKTGHAFTASFLRKSSSMIINSGPLFLIVTIGCLVAAAIISWPDVNMTIVGIVIAATLWILLSGVWNQATRRIGVKCPRILLPAMMLWRPVVSLYFRIASRFNRQRNYTWV